MPDRKEWFSRLIGIFATIFTGMLICLLEEKEMDFVLEIIKYIAAAVVGIILTMIMDRRSQARELNATLKDISKQLGLNDDKSLRVELLDMCIDLRKDIGRRDEASLTEQHRQLTREIDKSFGTIEKRYEAEDRAYREFTTQQHDLKKTMENFIRDYSEVINERSEYMDKSMALAKENDILREQAEELKREIMDLKSAINKTKQQEHGMDEAER